MGQRSSAVKKDSFSGVLPSSQAAKRACGAPAAGRASPPSSRPVEAVVPVIEAPPHVLQCTLNDLSTPVSPRRDTEDAFAVPESVRKSRTLEQFETTCSEILPDVLYVSNLHVAQDRDQLKRVGITHVINCCKEIVCFPEQTLSDTMTYLQLTVRDGVQEDLAPFFPLVIEFIEQARLDNGRILIHCHQGVSRSCAFAIAYVMYHKHIGFHAANAMVKAKRSICSPNTAFICQLLEWERELAAAETGQMTEFGLYRLTPHAAYDPLTLILKPCYYKDTRRKVVVRENRLEWFWGSGLFVFMEPSVPHAIVIWKGAQCTIPNSIEQAKAHVHRMLRVLGAKEQEVLITVVDGAAEDMGMDHFAYANELSWMGTTTLEPSSIPPPIPEPVASAAVEEKPQLFLLEDPEGQWEPLTNYDSDDLVPSSVLLLVTPTRAYLWLGQNHFDSTLIETWRKKAHVHVNPIRDIQVEHQNNESSSFWETFEAGY